MIKKDISKKLTEKFGFNHEDSSLIVDEVFNTMKQSIAAGESIYIRGLFTIKPVLRKSKKVRDIRNCTSFVLEEHYTPKAIFCKRLKEMVSKRK